MRIGHMIESQRVCHTLRSDRLDGIPLTVVAPAPSPETNESNAHEHHTFCRKFQLLMQFIKSDLIGVHRRLLAGRPSFRHRSDQTDTQSQHLVKPAHAT